MIMEFLRFISGPAIIGFIIGFLMSVLSSDPRPLFLTLILPLAILVVLLLVRIALWIQEKIFR